MYCNNCMNEIREGTFCTHCMTENTTQCAPHHLTPGTMLSNKYIVGNAIGEGGFGITYIGRDTTLDIRVAIKEYFPNGYANRNHERSSELTITTQKQKDFFEKGKDRFLLEARSIAKFNQEKGIVHVRDYFEENGTAYIIMEYLDGITLSDYVKANGTMDATQLFSLMKPVMQSLKNIHDNGIIHRDISPDNIMYQTDGTLKLMDFGSARYFNDQENMLSVVLKMGYAPEEQYRKNGDQGPWTDVYGICATMYRCITGKVPEEALDRLHVDNLQTPSQLGVDIPKPLEATIMYGMAVYKENRCQNMEELLALGESAITDTFHNSFAPSQPTEYKTVAADGEYLNNSYNYTNEYGDQYHSVNQSNQSQPVKNKKSSCFLIGLIVAAVALLVVLLLVVLGIVLYSFISDGSSDSDETTAVVTEEVTQTPTEKPTEAPTQAPTEKPTEPYTGVDLYTDVIDEALSKSSSNQKYARGYLYDLNSDGVKELVMIYETDEYTPRCVTSVYSIKDSGVEVLLYEKELYEYVGGPFGCISIVKENGKILFCTNGETGETSGQNMYRYGFWDMYSFDGEELELEYETQYEYYSDGSNINYNDSTATVNGRSMSYRNYKTWLDDGLDLVAYMSPDLSGVRDSNGNYSPNSTALNLKDLLNKIK